MRRWASCSRQRLFVRLAFDAPRGDESALGRRTLSAREKLDRDRLGRRRFGFGRLCRALARAEDPDDGFRRRWLLLAAA
ncbi:MAG TPA: hypothetical protein DFS52_12980 [Myxococcales bacterium]|nr:hypothetical protein [Myxococcales bacterium]